jgi:hypothetical protein
LIAGSTFAAHPYAQKAITEASLSILNDRFYSTSDQVENCIKPYKFEIEVEDNEWIKGRESVSKVLKNELKACDGALKQLEERVGKRKLKDVTAFIDRVRKGEVVLEGDGSGGAGGFSSALLQRGKKHSAVLSQCPLLIWFITQAAKRSFFVTGPPSSKCASWPFGRANAPPRRTNITVPKSSWMSLQTNSLPRLSYS